MLCVPAAREEVENVTTPEELRVAVLRADVPSLNVIVPVGTVAGPVTVTVKVTLLPTIVGLAELCSAILDARRP
jgi:hypothetical protein